jgi:hypothetical protein
MDKELFDSLCDECKGKCAEMGVVPDEPMGDEDEETLFRRS